MGAKKKTGTTAFRCTSCGYTQPRWLGRCPDCGEWNTLEEIILQDAGTASGTLGAIGSGSGSGPAAIQRAVPLASVDASDGARLPTGIGELDRVLGGSAMKRSAIAYPIPWAPPVITAIRPSSSGMVVHSLSVD